MAPKTAKWAQNQKIHFSPSSLSLGMKKGSQNSNFWFDTFFGCFWDHKRHLCSCDKQFRSSSHHHCDNIHHQNSTKIVVNKAQLQGYISCLIVVLLGQSLLGENEQNVKKFQFRFAYVVNLLHKLNLNFLKKPSVNDFPFSSFQ